MGFDVAVLRDWVISVAGIVVTVAVVVLLVVTLRLFGMVASLMSSLKAIMNTVEMAAQSPLYQIASLIGTFVASISKGGQDRE